MNARVPASYWIDVNKQLPDYDEYVLWIYESGHIYYGCIDKDDTLELFFKRSHSEVVGDIIAWMPEPEYPKDLIKEGLASTSTFLEKCINGEVSASEVDKFVSEWHQDKNNNQSLASFLGMTDAEYNTWLVDSSTLPSIIQRRKYLLERNNK